MSGNERVHEISAPNRHSRTGGNQPQRPEMPVTPAKNKIRPQGRYRKVREYHLRPLADEYCDQWKESVAQDETPPMPSSLFEKLPGKSFLRLYFPAVFNYLNDCRRGRYLPQPNRILPSASPRPSNADWCPSHSGRDPEATPTRSLPKHDRGTSSRRTPGQGPGPYAE